MALIKEYLLSIAIPTYNRSAFLDDALLNIESQIKNEVFALELIVSDNCSSDDTFSVVQKYIDRGLPIRYVRNEINKGADFNIAQCFKLAKGAYVLVFGDDDILLEGALKILFFYLENRPQFGILYLDYRLRSAGSNKVDSKLKALKFVDYEEFFKKVSHSITFISGNIINSKFINEVNPEKYYTSNLVQLAFYLAAAFKAEYNLVLSAPLVAVPADNSGGYGICKVFGENINWIFNEFTQNEKQKRVFINLKNDLMVTCFPTWIKRLKTAGHKFEQEDIHKLLHPIFKNYLSYWFMNYPLIVQSDRVLKITWPFFRVYLAVLRRIIPRFRIKSTHHTIIEIK